MATDARISQAPVETLLAEAPGAVRVTQGPVEVLRGPEPVVWAQVAQGALEILILGDPTVPTIVDGTTYAAVDLPDPSTYYTGFKDGRVLSFGTATRTLSDLTGQWSANDLSCSLADTDRAVRNVLATSKALRETPVVIRMISDADRRARLTPVVVFRGSLRAWTPRGDLAVDLEYTDAVGLKLSRRGKDRMTPSRTVAVADFPGAPSTSQGKAVPIIYGKHQTLDGCCPLIYVGLKDIGMGSMHTWVVAGHACIEVDLFIDDVMLVGTSPGSEWWHCPPGNGEPAYAGWTLPTTYVDINGRRYTLVQGNSGLALSASDATDALTATNHGLSDGDVVSFSTSKALGTHTLPEPLRSGSDYYVRNKTAHTFQVSETLDGDIIDLTTNGVGVFKFDIDPDLVVAGTKTLTANLYGIDSTGDGTGILLSQSFLQYLHFFKQFVLQDYQSGDWSSDPLEWETGWSQINEQSFVDAQTESRRWVTGNGYEGQAYIGPEAKTLRDVLATWNTSLNCRLGQNRYHQWTVHVLPGALTPAELVLLHQISDAQDVLQASLSFDMEGMQQEVITRSTVSAFKIPKESDAYAGVETYRDSLSETDAGYEIDSELFLDFLPASSPTTISLSAEDVAKRWIGFRTGSISIYRVTFRSSLCTYEAIDVGDLFRLTHFAGTTSTGYENRVMWCESMALDIDQKTVTVTALDVTHAYEGTRTLEEIVEPAPIVPGETPPPPPIESGSGMMAPLGFAGALIDAAEGSAYYGEPGTTEYYKLVAVFDSGEESKPATIGPIVTDGDGGTLTRKRVHLTWDAYPTTAQTSPSGASVTPTAMRVYRSALSDFSVSQKMDRELYPVPEEPGDFRCTGSSGSGTDYIYRVYQYYYLSGRSPDGTEITVNSGALPDDVDVSLAWIADPAVDQVNRGTPDTYADGVMVAQVFGRDDSDGHGGPGRYLSVGLYGSYHDDGRDTQKGGGGIEPFPAAPTGVDIPVTGTSLYDQWPGKQDVADNPWVTV